MLQRSIETVAAARHGALSESMLSGMCASLGLRSKLIICVTFHPLQRIAAEYLHIAHN
jgi:hypothetical protein